MGLPNRLPFIRERKDILEKLYGVGLRNQGCSVLRGEFA